MRNPFSSVTGYTGCLGTLWMISVMNNVDNFGTEIVWELGGMVG